MPKVENFWKEFFFGTSHSSSFQYASHIGGFDVADDSTEPSNLKKSESGFGKFVKWKVENKSFHSPRSAKWNKSLHSFSRSEKRNQNASRPRSRSKKFREFLNISQEKKIFNKIILWKPKKIPDIDDLLL